MYRSARANNGSVDESSTVDNARDLSVADGMRSIEDDHGPTDDVAPGQLLELGVDVIQRHGRDGVLDQPLTRKREHFGEVVVVSPERAEVRLLSIRERQQR